MPYCFARSMACCMEAVALRLPTPRWPSQRSMPPIPAVFLGAAVLLALALAIHGEKRRERVWAWVEIATRGVSAQERAPWGGRRRGLRLVLIARSGGRVGFAAWFCPPCVGCRFAASRAAALSAHPSAIYGKDSAGDVVAGR